MANMFLDMMGWKLKSTKEDKKIDAGYVAPQNDDAVFTIGEGYYGSYAYQLNFDQNITDEFQLIHKYRAISLHPEVDRAIAEIVNEVIDGTTDKVPVRILLDNLQQPDSIKKTITDEFENILHLLDFNNKSYTIFRKWYVDGRLFYHIVIDTDKPIDGIKELRYVSPLHIKKIREERTELRNGIPIVVSAEDYFIYSRDLKNTLTPAPGTGGIKLPSDSVAYCTSSLIDEQKNLVYSYLQKAIRPTNILRMEEDALVIYRLARAPERRIFKVDVGNLPKATAEQYMRNLQAKYKNQLVYDGGTGEVKDSSYQMTMLEDFWLPVRENGRGTDVTTLPGGENLGEINDIEYFRKKVMESLNVPMGRLTTDGGSGGFNMGRPEEISREEVQFAAFIEKIRKEFSQLFYTLLRTQLILKKVIAPDEWDREFKNQIKFDFLKNTFFAELKENEMLREKLVTLQLIDPRPPIGIYFSEEWAKKHALRQTEEEIAEMQKQMDKEKEKNQVDGYEGDPTSLFGGSGPMGPMGAVDNTGAPQPAEKLGGAKPGKPGKAGKPLQPGTNRPPNTTLI